MRAMSALAAIILVFQTIASPGQVYEQSRSSSAQNNEPELSYFIHGDSGDGQGGLLIGLDPSTGEQWVISSGQYLSSPLYLVRTENGLLVSDHGLLLRVDLATGEQTILAELGDGWGVTVDRHGHILIATSRGILRLNSLSGQIEVVSAGGDLRFPLAVAIARNGHLIVLDGGFPNRIFLVNPHNGKQTLLCEGGLLHGSKAIAVSGEDIYVTGVASPDGNFGIGRVVHVDLRTGTQTIISEGGYLVGPMGIAIDENGRIVVCDPYTVNPESFEPYDGGVIAIDAATGVQTLLTRQGEYKNPTGLALLRNP